MEELINSGVAFKGAGAVLVEPDWHSDWHYAFEVANRDGVSACLGTTCSVERFELKDVAEVLGSAEGENDGANWIVIVRLNDGRFAFVTAGCDYTGWGCRDGGHVMVAPSLPELLLLGLGDEERERLGVVL